MGICATLDHEQVMISNELMLRITDIWIEKLQ